MADIEQAPDLNFEVTEEEEQEPLFLRDDGEQVEDDPYAEVSKSELVQQLEQMKKQQSELANKVDRDEKLASVLEGLGEKIGSTGGQQAPAQQSTIEEVPDDFNDTVFENPKEAIQKLLKSTLAKDLGPYQSQIVQNALLAQKADVSFGPDGEYFKKNFAEIEKKRLELPPQQQAANGVYEYLVKQHKMEHMDELVNAEVEKRIEEKLNEKLKEAGIPVSDNGGNQGTFMESGKHNPISAQSKGTKIRADVYDRHKEYAKKANIDWKFYQEVYGEEMKNESRQARK